MSNYPKWICIDCGRRFGKSDVGNGGWINPNGKSCGWCGITTDPLIDPLEYGNPPAPETTKEDTTMTHPKTHHLKTWPQAFLSVHEGRKTAEYRKLYDRDFAVGDALILEEFDPNTGLYSGNKIGPLTITDITTGFGIHDGYGLISFTREPTTVHETLEAEIVRLKALISRIAPEDPVSQDEMGGCVWCGGSPDGEPYGYATDDPKDHEDDCPWVEARAVLVEEHKEHTGALVNSEVQP